MPVAKQRAGQIAPDEASCACDECLHRKGVGSGEWEVGTRKLPSRFSTSHSPFPTPHSPSNTHHLNVDFAVVRAIELGKENVLPDSEFQPAVNDRNGNAVADDDGAEVRVGVSAITIGKQRII